MSRADLTPDDPHSYTVLRAVSPKESLLTKVFTRHQEWISYGGRTGDRQGAYLYSARTVDILSLDDLEAELRVLDNEPRCCFVAGAIIDGSDRENMRRIKYEHKRIDKKTGEAVIDKPTLHDVPRFLIPLDVDSLPCPDGIDPKDLTIAASYIRSQLPPVFRNAACVAQATSGHCIKSGLRFRMFFLLDHPLTCSEIRTWLAHTKAPVDLSIYGPNAVVYTASPVFEDSSHDPLPGGRIVRLAGDESVTAPSTDELAAMKPARKPHNPRNEKVILPPEWREIEEALNAIPNGGDGQIYDVWLWVGMALHWLQYHKNSQSGEDDKVGFELWDQWSQSSNKYDPITLEMKWDSFDAERGGENGPITSEYIFKLARDCGYELDEFARDQRILEAISDLRAKAENLDKQSRAYKATKHEAIELFAKLSSDYRGDPNETKRFRIDWGMDSRTLNESLKKHGSKRRKEEKQKNSSGLQFTESGTLFPNLQNACHLMLADSEMRNVFKFNQMTLDIDVMQPIPVEASRGSYPHKLGDVDISDAMLWLQKREMFMVTETTTRSAVQNIAFNNQYHPVRDYLASLQWDGTPRIDTWLIDYGGAKDNLYVRQIAAMFLIQMVARVMEPGCKADYILFLVGPQGIFKSTVASKLGKQWFSDDLPDIRDKRKTSLHLCGLWVAELSELSSMSRAEVEDWKAFAARRVDKYQKPYGHYETIQPRQNVFIGTTNDSAPLKDKTGNRRDWIVEVRKFDVEKLVVNLDQLFAEAYARYGNGEHWWPDEAIEAKHFVPEQESFVAEENWEILLTEQMQELRGNKDEGIENIGIKSKDITQFMQDKFPRVPTKMWKKHLEKLDWEYKSKRPKSGEKPYDPIWVWSHKGTKHVEHLRKWNSGGFGEGPGHWYRDTPVEGAL